MSNFLTNNDLNLGALYIEKTTQQVYQILSRKIGFRNPKANYLGVIAKNIESGVIKEFSSGEFIANFQNYKGFQTAPTNNPTLPAFAETTIPATTGVETNTPELASQPPTLSNDPNNAQLLEPNVEQVTLSEKEVMRYFFVSYVHSEGFSHTTFEIKNGFLNAREVILNLVEQGKRNVGILSFAEMTKDVELATVALDNNQEDVTRYFFVSYAHSQGFGHSTFAIKNGSLNPQEIVLDLVENQGKQNVGLISFVEMKRDDAIIFIM
ncbi:hypothetical protein FEF33_04320 [Moraxella osloensis]|nr:hypothetical protein FEF33_04320 [Moraxella osloensis]RVU81266.1 hypothetical protein EOL70_27980 [Leucothrix sargassi]